ncbi:MAG: hypothetical protein HY260_12705 [Chloroflexi bacterium]|nr:hypothetical protein [Chloroflexota bacterium]
MHWKTRILSWDTLLFAGLSFAYVIFYRDDAKGNLLVLTLTAYLLVDYFFPWSSAGTDSRSGRWVVPIKMSLVLLVVALVVILPTAILIAARHASGPATFAHDGMIQIEAALEFLSRGQSPYGQDYSRTAMSQVQFPIAGVAANPALTHLIYMPLLLEISYPVYRVSLQTLGWWDQRFLYIAVLALTLGVLPQIVEDPSRKSALMLMLGINALLMVPFLEGHNEIVMIFLLVLSAWALQRNWRTTGAVWFALACAAKQLAWIFAPFFLIYLLGPWPWRRAQWRQAGREMLPGIVLASATVLPFLLWTPRQFIEDTLIYMLGASGTETYVAIGSGLGGLLMISKVLSSPMDDFPFLWIELAVALPLAIWFGRQLLRQRRPALIWQYGGLLGLAAGYFHRYYHYNYVGTFVFLVALGMLADEPSILPISHNTTSGRRT